MSEEIYIVEEITETVEIIERGEQGPPGSGGSSTTTKVASETIGVYEVVRLTSSGEAAVCDPTVESDIETLFGVATQSVAAASSLNIRVSGEITDAGWSWTPGEPLWLGVGGVLTQTIPPDGTTAAIVRMGVAITATVIRIDIDEPIFL